MQLTKSETPPPPAEERWSLFQLLVASFLTLFAELAFIRWIAVEVRIFAYVKNLALLLCFLGFGLGCALSRRRPRWGLCCVALLSLLGAVRGSARAPELLEGLSGALGSGADLQIWASSLRVDWRGALVAAGVSGALMTLLLLVFIPMGQVVSQQLDRAPSQLRGYSWNLAGSLAGILAFFAACRLMLPPAVWLGAVLAAIAALQPSARSRVAAALLILPTALLLREPSSPDRFAVWTPYQQIGFTAHRFPDGELQGATVSVNHTGYQWIVNLAPDFLARHPAPQPVEENAYNLPFRFASPQPSVLIVGAGTGNDVAAGLRNASRSIDAVEIDPEILAIGRAIHPEHPYDSPRVTAHLTDARAFLKRAQKPYDLVLFGLLDSHTQLSDYANMRVDSFVYTEESIREAKRLLGPRGVLFIKFSVVRPWLGRRLAQLVQHVFGKPPVVFQVEDDFVGGLACIAISPDDQIERALAADPHLARFVQDRAPAFADGTAEVLTTDDWPYLYQQARAIPSAFITVGVLVALIALVSYASIPEARQRPPSLFFFAMGAGFLLLETQVISRLALFFGTTWQVNGIVIAAVLTALLLANVVIERRASPPRRSWVVAGLLGGLGLAYFLPLGRIPGPAAVAGIAAAVIFAVPVFFAGLLFATEFRRAQVPSAALGANMLGAVLGGLLENLSLVFGMRSLLLVAAVLYAVAAWAARRVPAPALS